MSFLFPSSTITLEAALRDLTGGSAKARAIAAHALGDIDDPTARRRAAEALRRALEDDRPEVRAEACASLGSLGDTTAIPLLVRRLDDGVTVVRQNAAIALGSIGHADGFESLAEALRAGPADLRFQAATSLVEIDARRAYGPIVASLEDRDPQVVAAAALSLGAIGNREAIPQLLRQIDHLNDSTRFDVAYALSELGDASGLGILVIALADADRAWDAVTALATLGDADGLASTLTMKKVAPEPMVLAAGSLLFLRSDDQPARRVLVAALGARKVHVRGLAVEQLAKVGGDWAVIPLEKLARSGKGGELLEPIAMALRAIAERGSRSGGNRIEKDP